MPARERARYTAATEFLFAQKAQGARFGVDRMRALARELGHPERIIPCIHIAGTNGKGSVAAMVEVILREAGWRTGLYTSPHLVHPGERVQVNRQPLSATEVADFVAELRPLAQRVAAVDPDAVPSFFEYMTAMAFLQFTRKQCDIAVFEVGLGGRLDATNIVEPEVTVITSIGLDHCELLGADVESIAREKAGIVKAGRPVIMGRMPRAAEAVVRRIAQERGADVVSVSEQFGDEIASYPQTNVEGDYQRWNAATATLTVQALPPQWKITKAVLARALSRVNWPGRWQRVSVEGRTVILDASHNPEGAQTLDSNLTRLVAETGRLPIIIVGVLGTGRAGPLMETICRHAGKLHLIVPQQPRACRFEELEALVPATYRGAVMRDSVARLFPSPGKCAAGGPTDVIVVTGSIYLLGEIMERLGPRQIAT
ncbi:MAG: hypothetical protein RIQ93_1873 [Verrucomicrobiota bacterium]|jgi:dihydrofolate synthase/folylpolyglutamate synthase